LPEQETPLADPKLRSKILSLDRGDLWVEVLQPSPAGLPEPESVTFPLASIAEMGSFGPNHSFLKLHSGRDVYLALPLDALKSRLREADDDVVDLKSVTYLQDAKALTRELRAAMKEEFDFAALSPEDQKQRKMIEGMTFHVQARSPTRDDFRPFTFSGADLTVTGMEEGSSMMGGKNLSLTLRHPAGTPFPTGRFIIEMSRQEFLSAVDQAYMGLQKDVDLTAATLAKGTRFPPQKGPQP
jgi:hypothetical protein